MGNRASARLAAVALAAVTATAARGQTAATWSTGVSGSWTDGTRWSTQPNYPNNGTPAGATYTATIDAAPVTDPYTVTLGGGANVTVNALTLNQAAATLAITGGSSLTTTARNIQSGAVVLNNGTLNLPGDDNRLLGGGTIRFDGAGGLVDFYDVTGDSAFNVFIDDATIRTGTGSGTVQTEYGSTLWFDGAAIADTTGRQLSLLSGHLRNDGTISASNGATLRIGHPHPGLRGNITNFGSITVNNATLELASQFFIKSTFIVTNSALKIGGEKWTPAEILALPLATNTLWIKGGTIDVTNTTFQLSAATGSLNLDNALFTGGRLTAQPGYEYISRSTDPIDHPSQTFNSTLAAPLRITNGDRFWGNSMTVDGATIRLESAGDSTRLNFGGTMTFTGTGTVIFDGSVIAGTNGNAIYNHVGAFTLGPGITVTTGTASGVIGSASISTDPIINQGTIAAVTSGRTITIAPKTFTNTGLIESRNGGTVTLAGTGTTTFTNISANTLTGGEYKVTAGSTLSFGSRTFTTNGAKVVLEGVGSVFNAIAPLASNTGTFEIDKGRNFTTVGALANSGTLRVGKDSTLTVNGALTNTGKLKGQGTIVASSVSSSGTIAPGDSPGLLSIAGNLTLSDSSLVEIEIGGTAPGVDYDVLDVTSNLALNGTLQISFINGFQPGPNDFFDFFDFVNASGAFDNVIVPTLPAGVVWDTSSLAAGGPVGVPEPSGVTALIAAAATTLARRNRRR